MARKMTSDEYKEVGRGFYKLKQYEKAVEAFTQGIDIAPTLSLFDHRAAAYDRVEDYNAAVKDGREMIKLDKKDVKGYLRTASVLEKMEKLETALSIYKYGMKNVPVADKNFKLLQQLHDKTTRKLSPAKSVDPLTVLPVELAEMVLEYFTFRHLVNCMRVNKGWRDYIAKLSRLWMHLDLSGARRPVPRKFVDKAVRRSKNCLTRVTIHRFEHVDVLKNVAKACKGLTELEFISLPHTMASTLIDIVACAPKLEKFIVHPDITADTASQILNTRPTLKQVGFNSIKSTRYNVDWKGPFTNLESFSLQFGNTTDLHRLSLDALLTRTPTLQSLNLSNFHAPPNLLLPVSTVALTSLILKRAVFSFFPILPPTLQTLIIEYNGSFPLHGSRNNFLASRLPALTHLSLSEMNPLSADSFEELLDTYVDQENPGQLKDVENATPLRSLSIHCVLRYPDEGLFDPKTVSLFTRSPRILTPALQHLDVAKLLVNDNEIEHLLSHDIGLVSIDVSYTYITGASIKMLVDKLPSLKTIKADNCTRINGRDAIEYAMRKGVVVSCSMIEGNGGRKIRH